MNHFKKGVLALALVAGISGAFAQKMSKSAVKEDPQVWETFDTSGNSTGFTQPLTESEIREQTNCEGLLSQKCAQGQADHVIIYRL